MGNGNYNGGTLRLKNEQDFDMHDCGHSEQTFIDCIQANASLVQVHLFGGTRLLGRILGSDDHTILLSKKRGGSQMIYKTGITTISKFEENE